MPPSNRRTRKPKLPPEVRTPSDDDVWPDQLELDLSGENAGADARSTPPPALPKVPRVGAKAMAIAKGILGAALVIAVSAVVAWGARRYVKTSPRFAVTDVDVSGTNHLTPEGVSELGKLTMGANIFSVDLDQARARLLGHPWIKDVELSRRLPGRITVRIVEREAGAIVALGDTYLASKEGDVFKRFEAGDPADLPVLTGLTLQAFSEDKEGAERTVRRALDLAGEYERGPLAEKAPLQEVHVGGGGAFTLTVGKSAVALVLGDPPYRKKLDQAVRVFAELERRGGKADAIMLDNEARPDRVVVRMR
ncbi:MAG: FtsQ-type POTRA domain-containing protein [Polyangiaceae bacterium]